MLAFDPHFDLAVVGGGPAGASAAITFARNGGRTLLLEAKSFPRHKVCGEFISAESLDVLSSLLRDSPTGRELIKSAPTIRETRLYHGNRMIQAPVSPPALSIARYRLDAVLWEAAKAEGVEALAACEVTAVAGNGPFRLTTSQGQYEANALIIAAGRWSLFTSNRSVPAGPKWIGVKGHFHEADPSFTTDLYFFDHGYCGVQPVSDGIVNACAMVRSDRAASLAEVFKLHPRLAERAAEWEAVAQPVSTAPLVYRRPEPTAGNRLFAGDAAAFIDPFAGDGISIALRSGRAAAEALAEFVHGESDLAACVSNYGSAYVRQFSPLLAAAAKVRSLLSLPKSAQAVAFELLRLPGVMPMVIRKTRRAS